MYAVVGFAKSVAANSREKLAAGGCAGRADRRTGPSEHRGLGSVCVSEALDDFWNDKVHYRRPAVPMDDLMQSSCCHRIAGLYCRICLRYGVVQSFIICTTLCAMRVFNHPCLPPSRKQHQWLVSLLHRMTTLSTVRQCLELSTSA